MIIGQVLLSMYWAIYARIWVIGIFDHGCRGVRIKIIINIVSGRARSGILRCTKCTKCKNRRKGMKFKKWNPNAVQSIDSKFAKSKSKNTTEVVCLFICSYMSNWKPSADMISAPISLIFPLIFNGMLRKEEQNQWNFNKRKQLQYNAKFHFPTRCVFICKNLNIQYHLSSW